MNDFQAPVNAQNAVAQKITDFLASSNLAPAQQDLISAANEAVKNVVAAVSAKERDAAQASFQCWVNALDVRITLVPTFFRRMQTDTIDLQR